MNTPLALDEIEKAAEAATKGPRHVERDTEVRVDDYGITLALCDTNTAGIKEPGKDWYEEAKADAQLIAHLDPATVLELVRLARIGERYEQVAAQGWQFVSAERFQFLQQNYPEAK